MYGREYMASGNELYVLGVLLELKKDAQGSNVNKSPDSTSETVLAASSGEIIELDDSNVNNDIQRNEKVPYISIDTKT